MGKRANLVIKVTNDTTMEDIEAQAFEQLSSAGMETALAANAANEIAVDMIRRRAMIVRNGGTMEIGTNFLTSDDDDEDRIVPLIEALNRTGEALISVVDTVNTLTKNQRRFSVILMVTLGLILFGSLMLNLIVADAAFHR